MTRPLSVAAASLAAAVVVPSAALAEGVGLDLVLEPANASQNTINMTVSALTASSSDSSQVSGNALTQADIDFLANGQVDAINSLSFTGGNLAFLDALAFNLDFSILGSVNVAGGGLAGVLGTPGPASPVDAGGGFDLSFHDITVNQGVLNATGSIFGTPINTAVDFSTEPTNAALTGAANLAVSLNSVVGNTGTYSATLTAPIAFSAPFEVEGVTITVDATGNLIATDTFARQLTTPGDLTGDGLVDVADLDLLLEQWGATGPNAADGDGSQLVDQADLDLVLDHWGDGDPPDVNIPEPGSLALLALGALALNRRRR